MFRRAVLAGLLASLALASCTPDDDGSKGPRSAPSASSSPTTGHVRFGVLGDVATLDPYSPLASDLTFALVRPVYPSLYSFDPDGSPRNYLAGAIDVSGGSAVVTLADMEWSHGGNVTARDVVASWRRAGERSGFSEITSARATGPDEVTFNGDVSDWESTLARNAFVLPKGKVSSSFGGPYIIKKRVPGLSVSYRPNPAWNGAEQGFDRVTVFSTDSTSIMLSLLKRGRLDAAWFPSTVNLADRLEASELRYQSVLGWSSIQLRSGSALSPEGVGSIAAATNRLALEEAFISDDGRVTESLHPRPGEGGVKGPAHAAGSTDPFSFVLAAPHGDELLGFLQHALQLQLAKSGFEVEIIDLPVKDIYSEFYEGVSLLRVEGAPGAPDPESAYRSAVPLFHVKSYLVWNERLEGLEVNPTSDGPLWNLEAWSGSASQEDP